VVEVGAFAPALGSIVLVDQLLKAALLTTEGTPLGLRVSRSRQTLATAIGLPVYLLPVMWMAILAGVLLVAPRAGMFESELAWAGLGAAMGGAASNLADRFLRGAVVDYIDLRVWPAFNLADTAIVIGVLLALIA
jgi:lipoprotein signal peptidase